MAAGNVTIPGSGGEYEVDTNQYTATLQEYGGYVQCTHASTPVYVHVNAGTLATPVVQPVGAGGRVIKPGQAIRLPADCSSFTFKSTGASLFQWSKEAPVL
jgi:hypothetical protein